MTPSIPESTSQPVHRINLKGPWSYEWLDGPHPVAGSEERISSEDSPLLADSRVRMPSSWQSAFGSSSGRIRFRRRFQKPTNLDDNERVHMAFDGIGGSAVIAVNGRKIAEVENIESTVSYDVTRLLDPSNEVSVEISFTPDECDQPGGLSKPVVVEIHCVATDE